MRAAVLVLLVGAASSFVEKSEWNSFKLNHGKTYTDPAEDSIRMKVYAVNKASVDQHMKEYAEGKHTFTVALNKFSDLTTEEWSAMHDSLTMDSSTPHEEHQLVGQSAPSSMDDTQHQMTGKAVPMSRDWRKRDVVTSVKDQYRGLDASTTDCGSCWAFSAIGAMESAWAIAGHPLVSLSEQQLMDCSREYGNYGCAKGSIASAFRYIKDKGIVSEARYPYKGRDGPCRVSGPNLATLSSWRTVRYGNESELQDAVGNVGPLSVKIAINKTSFRHYKSGIYHDPSCSSSSSQLNHAVLAVGYDDGYWIVKNSYGTDWGQDGYVHMTRGDSNQCGIATDASYPIVGSVRVIDEL